MRELKFRGIHVKTKKFVYGMLMYSCSESSLVIVETHNVPPSMSDPCGDTVNEYYPIVNGTEGQYTGLQDKDKKEVYEDDIFRIEDDDSIFYVVIIWVQEWCMFASLLVSEYNSYKAIGLQALDEPMFWTYTLEDTDSRKHFLCGNIHQNKDLL